MLATLIIVFREIIEAGLVVGIVLAATKGIANRGFWVGYGILGGVISACIIALFAHSISEAMAGVGQELLNAIILILAVIMLILHNVWMARHGREIVAEMKDVGNEVRKGNRSLLAMAIVVGVAVLREGSEVVLFLYGIVISSNESMIAMIIGGVVGLALGVLVSATTYFGLLKIPNRHLFKATSIMLALLAAGMAAQATSFLEQAQFITTLNAALWNSSWLISDASIAGKTLHTLVGYTARPSVIQFVIYLATIFIIFALMKIFAHSTSPDLRKNN